MITLPAVIAVRPDFVNGGYDSGERDNSLYLTSTQERESNAGVWSRSAVT
jgi:hypothetical protein